ncbi:MAG: hypothetical protein WCA20_25830 [Candidatus Sulfotelmatobacter sp.]
MIVIPASLRSDFIHMPGMTIHIALESTIHIVGIRIIWGAAGGIERGALLRVAGTDDHR